MRPLSRRGFLAGTAGLGLLAACGDGGGGSAGGPAPAAPGFPLTVTHVHGSTEIPAPPRRVVSVGYSEQDTILALGVAPVAVREWFGRQPSATYGWARDAFGDTRPEVLGLGDGLEFERIASLRPDLILAPLGGITAEEYPLLSRIAPTVAHRADLPEYGTPWPELTRSVGRMLGRTEQAEQVVARVQDRFAQTVAEHTEFAGRTAVAAYDFGSTVGAYSPTADPRGRFLADLGFGYPPALGRLFGDGTFFGELSREQLALLDADVVVWVVYREPGDEQVAGIEDDPVYQTLRVSREARHVFLRDDETVAAAFSFSSPLSLPVVLDGLVPRIAGALDGDPATS